MYIFKQHMYMHVIHITICIYNMYVYKKYVCNIFCINTYANIIFIHWYNVKYIYKYIYSEIYKVVKNQKKIKAAEV